MITIIKTIICNRPEYREEQGQVPAQFLRVGAGGGRLQQGGEQHGRVQGTGVSIYLYNYLYIYIYINLSFYVFIYLSRYHLISYHRPFLLIYQSIIFLYWS